MDSATSKLIRAARRSSVGAIWELIDRWGAAYSQVLPELKKGRRIPDGLRAVVEHARASESIPALIELSREKNRIVRKTAWIALVGHRSREVAALVDQALRDHELEMDRRHVVEAIGLSGDPSLAAILRELVAGFAEPRSGTITAGALFHAGVSEDRCEEVETLLAAVASLARLGNHEFASVPMDLLEYSGEGAEQWEYAEVRARAAAMLVAVAGRGLLRSIASGLGLEDFGAHKELIHAAQHLGLKQSVPILLEQAGNPDPEIAAEAFFGIRKITGETPAAVPWPEDTSPAEMETWWGEKEVGFEDGVCYRRGRPISIRRLIGILEEEQENPEHVFWELKLITGSDFGLLRNLPLAKQRDGLRKIRRWYEREGDRFEDGCLYRYGYRQNAGALL